MADPLSKISFSAPLPVVGRITSGLGDPRDYGSHEGVDIAVPAGTSILAVAPGRVVDTGYSDVGYGYFVTVDHGGGVQSLYAHMRSLPDVVRGAVVTAGSKLGEVGSTGNSDGNHLHLSVFVNGVAQNVQTLIDLGTTGITRLLDSDVPCSEHLGNLIDWAACMGLDASDPTTNTKYEDALILGESLPDSSAGSLDLGGLIDLSPLIDALENAVLDVLTFPLRIWVNATDLSEAPLEDGKTAWAWVNDSDHVAMFATSIAVTLLAIFVLLIAVWSLVAPSASTAVKAVTNPVGTIAEQADKL